MASSLSPDSRLQADQKDKADRVKDAQQKYEAIKRAAERIKAPVPPYELLELIGKGAYGRVYKARDERSGHLVAVKIIEVDEQDHSNKLRLADDREETIRDFRKEADILQQLKENRTPNVNVIHDAFSFHSALYIVADYCTGGSVRTLQRTFQTNGRPAGLPEHFIIPIARELAVAIQGIHKLRILHRDIKCANIYITEDGSIQLGDFGIVGVIEDPRAKRNTFIGTPHWMHPAILKAIETGATEQGYGTEADVWSYGCVLLEMATGNPPYPHVHVDDLADAINEKPPSLDNNEYSQELRDLVKFCLPREGTNLPTADDILEHPAIADTSTRYPTSSLVKLVERFKRWEHGGGSRDSLWIAGPTDKPTNDDNEDDEGQVSDDDANEWIFSTSDAFDRRFSQMPNFDESELQLLQAPHGSVLPPALTPIDTKNISIAERVKREHIELSASRGEQSLARIYDINDMSGYQVSTPTPTPVEEPAQVPDLPLRNFTSDGPTRESVIEIDLDEAGADENVTSGFELNMDAINEDTIRPPGRHAAQDDEDDDDYQYGRLDEGSGRRATMEWTFPSAPAPAPATATAVSQGKRGTMDWTFETAEPATPGDAEFVADLPSSSAFGADLAPGFRPQLKHTTTEPIGHFRDFSHNMSAGSLPPLDRNSTSSMLDLDLGAVDRSDELEDPADIVRPSTASSMAGSTMTDMTSGNPFDLEDDPVQNEIDRNRFSYHKQWQSEGGRVKRSSHKDMPMHARGSSLSSNDADVDDGMADANKGRMPTSREMRLPSMSFENDQGFDVGADDPNHWPNFSDFDSFAESPKFPTLASVSKMNQQTSPTDRGDDTRGLASRSRETSAEPEGPEIQFPSIQPPHPDVLDEHADPQLLEDELHRSLNNLSMGLKSVEQALRQYANIEEGDEDIGSEYESGFESNREGTEDEYEAAEQLTSRRSKPRKLEVRSDSRPPTSDGMQ